MEKKMKHPLAAQRSFYRQNIVSLFSKKETPFKGWGRKRTGRLAVKLAQWFHRDFILLEDGFIRSVGLGIDASPSLSIVEDDLGIYYDATGPSRLEDLLGSCDFENDKDLMQQSRRAIELIKTYHISKYNSGSSIDSRAQKKYGFTKKTKRVLVVAQTEGDASLNFGLTEQFSTDEMIKAAVEENPAATIYLKIHPDTLRSRGKRSDIDMDQARERCQVIDDDINPILLLEYFDKVYTKTSQMGFEALLLGKECVCFGMPFYAGWGVTEDRVDCIRRTRSLNTEEIFAAAYILYTKYFNPYSQKPADIFDAIQTIVKYRDSDIKINTKAYFFGFSLWKHSFVKPFMENIASVNFINPFPPQAPFGLAIKKGMNEENQIYIWGKKEFDDVERYAKEKKIPIYRVEDGFIRSVGLGSDLTRPYSLVIDGRGIYFDPSKESDLEHLLNFHSFTFDELDRAKHIRNQIIEEKLSKYNNYDNISLQIPKNKTIVLIPGQVEDDASIKYGAPGMSNLKLLKQVRANAPESYIIYKPHPDVLAGNRVGQIEDHEALNYCDHIVGEVSLDSVLILSDEVHTITSLVGFEAIMRGIKVYTYGLPFYAGWGLSIDRDKCERRKRKLEVDELVAATLLLYPYYIDPLSRKICDAEVTLVGLKMERDKLESSAIYKKSLKWRNFISRKLQRLLRLIQRGSI